MKPIIQTINTGGSGFGVSYWKGWLGCEQKAFFIQEAKEAGLKVESTSQALVAGNVFHAFAELYYKLAMKSGARALRLDTKAVRFVDDAGDPANVEEAGWLQGEKLFRAYRSVFPPDELGEVIEVEKLYKGPAVEAAVDCKPFTFKPDMVVRLNKKDCKRLRKTRGLRLKPGYYMVDHKTITEKEWTDRMYMDEVQFTAYMVAWQAVHVEKLEGLLVNMVIKDSKTTFRTIEVPFPGVRARRIMYEFLQVAQARRNNAATVGPIANITHCYNFSIPPCAFIRSCHRGANVNQGVLR